MSEQTTGPSAAALEEKKLGNEAYKKKNFDVAMAHYERAITMEPAEITFRSNLAAVRFEQKRYEECAEICEKAIDVGRENRADFKLIAKAYARMSNAFKKLGELEKAKTALEKALTEHRTPEYRASLAEVRKTFPESRLSLIFLFPTINSRLRR